jgi:hypothetical protein
MGRNKLLAVLAAAAMPFVLTAWVQLVSVEQPDRVEPATPFTVVLQGLTAVSDEPIPLGKPDDVPWWGGSISLRFGVLIPSTWEVSDVEYRAGGGSGSLPFAPEEAAAYEALYPAPPGYEWRAFGTVKADLTIGSEVTFKFAITPDSRQGYYQLAYMTQGDGPPWQSSLLQAEVVVGQPGPAPHVVAFSPGDGSADVPLDADIRVTFDRDMDLASLREGGVTLWNGPVWYVQDTPSWSDGVSLKPDWMPPIWPPYSVPIDVFYNATTRTAVVEPQEPLRADTIYTLIVDERARASDGAPLAQMQRASFLTVSGPDTQRYTDVPKGHRFYEAIETLAEAGVVHGYGDGSFRPDEPVTRADLAEMLVLLLGLHTQNPGTPPPYTDVPVVPGDSVADFVREATDAGIVLGFPDGTFRPDETVTRIQLVRMIVRAAQAYLSPPPPGYDAGFADVDIVDLGYTNWAAHNHLIDGKAPGRFDPWSTATRGHAARILFGVWKLLPRPLPM